MSYFIPFQECYHAGIHRRVLQQKIDAPSPDGHGWKLEDGELSVMWVMKPAVLHQMFFWSVWSVVAKSGNVKKADVPVWMQSCRAQICANAEIVVTSERKMSQA